MPAYLSGLALRYYRGIGEDVQFMAPFKSMNFFIGANNAGKSTILTFIASNLNRTPPRADALEVFRGKKSGEMESAVGISSTQFVAGAANSIADDAQAVESLKKLSDALSLNGMVWLNLAMRGQNKRGLYGFSDESVENFLEARDWSRLFQSYHRGTSGGHLKQWVRESLARVLSAQDLNYPEVKLIPALRQVGPKGKDLSDYSGQGLIDRLAEVQSPDHHNREEEIEIFHRINRFVQTVTGRSEARIEVPYHRDHLLVHMDSKVLPLSSLGMGIHEVIMIAAFCTISQEQIVCIEEPEIHLHPLLQRKLVKYLLEQTNNQYFIATHSAAFIDTPGAAIFHVRNDGQQTTIEESILRGSRYNICLDLGCRASDLVQSNAVIWVEGPSDRVYLRHWVSSRAPDLIEGIHYSIMFYGGRLLSHLSADAEDISEFIALRSLNQNVALIMDSDKNSAREGINATKQRLLTEFQKGRGVCWITAGREIENYVAHPALQAAVSTVHPTYYHDAAEGGPYDHALYFYRKPVRGRTETAEERLCTNVDKVAVAKEVAKLAADLGVLDLLARIDELVAMIRQAND